MKRLAILLVLVLPLAATGQHTKMGPADKRPEKIGMPAPVAALTLPEEVTGQPDEYIRVTADTKATAVVWYSPDAGLKLFPPDLLKDTRTAVVTARMPGRYRLVGFATAGGMSSLAECVVVIEGPDPGPDPKPPGPGPGPAPTPFVLSLRAAWAAEADPKRAEHLAALAALYRQAAVGTVDLPHLKTWGELHGVLKAAAASLLPATALPHVRQAISAEFKATLPTSMIAPLDPASRVLAKETFERVGAALESLMAKGKR